MTHGDVVFYVTNAFLFSIKKSRVSMLDEVPDKVSDKAPD
jgi:hypothetical protein